MRMTFLISTCVFYLKISSHSSGPSSLPGTNEYNLCKSWKTHPLPTEELEPYSDAQISVLFVVLPYCIGRTICQWVSTWNQKQTGKKKVSGEKGLRDPHVVGTVLRSHESQRTWKIPRLYHRIWNQSQSGFPPLNGESNLTVTKRSSIIDYWHLQWPMILMLGICIHYSVERINLLAVRLFFLLLLLFTIDLSVPYTSVSGMKKSVLLDASLSSEMQNVKKPRNKVLQQ